tara:strand:+ start:2006 stop:2680 length:675 start_codon:yes stop_codon:yes gene_type:complete
LRTPLLIINEKNYLEVSGDNALSLAKAAESVSNDLGVEIVVAPPLPFLGIVANGVSIPVLSQHIDPFKPGSETGSIIPELVKSLNVSGSLVNHSEKRVPFDTLKQIISRLKEVGLVSVVCAGTSEEVSRIATLKPDFIAIEPPELIGSGIAVSKAKPEVVSDSVEVAKHVNSNVKVICGAGVVESEDVATSLKLGAYGVLVASGIVKASDWKTKISELAEPLVI